MLDQEKVKQQLQALIKQIGLKDEVKKHLRLKLTERLQKSHDLPKFQISSDTLRHRITSSIIKEHLDRVGCSCSASVFAAESLCDEKMLERGEIVELLNVQPTFKELSLLECLIQKAPGRGTFLRSVEIQTDQEEGHFSLEQKFTMMDLEYRRALEQKSNNVSLGKSHSCEDEKKWYEKELFRFKQFQGHKIKIKAGEEWRIKFQKYAEGLEKQYSIKNDRIRKKEKTFAEQFSTKDKNFEEKIKNWEKSAKSRLQLVEMKENSINRQKMNLEAERRRVLDDAKKANDEARQKGRQYEKLLLNVQKRIDYEVGVVKLSIEQAHNQKEQQSANRKRFVDEEYGKLMGIKETTDLLKVENERLVKENTVLREECKKLREEVRQSYGESSSKGDKIDSLRDEVTDLKNEKKDFEIKLWQQNKLRTKRQAEVVEARRQLESLRKRCEDESESSIDLGSRHSVDDLQRKRLEVQKQRRKDIELFKLQF